MSSAPSAAGTSSREVSWTTSPSDRGRTSRLGLPQDEPRAIAATGHGHRTERRRRMLLLAQGRKRRAAPGRPGAVWLRGRRGGTAPEPPQGRRGLSGADFEALRSASSRGQDDSKKPPPRVAQKQRRSAGAVTTAISLLPATELGLVASTVGRVLARHRVPHLSAIEPISGAPLRRRHSGSCYERPHPGDLLHIDVKKLGRVPDGRGSGSMKISPKRPRRQIKSLASKIVAPKSNRPGLVRRPALACPSGT